MKMEAVKDGFTRELYRVEWLMLVEQVDQYGHRTHDPPIVEIVFPTKEKADEALSILSTPHPFVQGRRVYVRPINPYHECCVSRRLVLETVMSP